tara:strand:- start:257 stop:553 length:297 start_codon:yes stop_codon:yes gene_type:complete
MDDTFRNNNITIVKENDFINVMLNFIYNNNHNVTNYDEIKEIYVKMVGNGFFFLINLELTIQLLHQLIYFLNSSQENRENLYEILTLEDNDNDEDMID